MKRSYLLVIIVLLLIPAGVSANGYLFINSTPSGAAIYLDNTWKGNTPYNQTIAAGSYTLVLRTGGYSDYSTTVTVVNNQTTKIDHVFVNPAPDISGVSPSSGFNTSLLSGVTITGSGFSTSGGNVVLTKSDETNITATGCIRTTTSITCSLLLTGAVPGIWTLVVTNPDGQYDSYSFTVKSQADLPTLTSIDPTSAEKNTTVTASIGGTNFASSATIRLVNGYYNDIYGTVNSVNSAGTVISGTFNLANQVPSNYQVCVYNSASIYICGLTFTILAPGESASNSSIYFETNPIGATIYLNNTEVGTSVFTYRNVSPGTYRVLARLDGYEDYSASVKVLANKRTTFYAKLIPVGQDTTVATTSATTVTTATTVRKSTLKVPTTWPSAAPTEASPSAVAIIVGSLTLAFIGIRRH